MHLCWQTVEQQFNPALAIASSVSTHSMKKDQHIIKPEFPLIELSFLGFMVFALGLTIRQILLGGEGYFLIIPLIIAGLLFGFFFTNYRNKKVERKGSELIVKPLLGKLRIFNVSNTKGFEFYETFDRSGLIKQIRLIDSKGNRIIFARDAYNDYEKLIQMIKNCGLEYLGEKEINWKYKRQYGLIAKIGFVLAIMLFFLLKLTENK